MTLLRALTFHPAAVEAEIIPISTEKKTAEFTAATDCQLSCMSLALKPPVVTPNVTTGLVSNMSANNYTEEPVLSADKNRMQAAQQPTMSDANGEEAKQERQQQDKLLISQHSILQDMTAQLLQVQAAARPAKKINKDEPTIYSSLEWRPLIYQEKLMRAREAIMTDAHIPMLRRFFDAELDNDSIRPV